MKIEKGDRITNYEDYVIIITKKDLFSGCNLTPVATWDIDDKVVYFDGFFWDKITEHTRYEIIKHEISEREIFLKLGLSEDDGIEAHKKSYRPSEKSLVEMFDILKRFDPLLTFDDFKNSYKGSN